MLFKTCLLRTTAADFRQFWPPDRDAPLFWERFLDCIGLGPSVEPDLLTLSFTNAKSIADHVNRAGRGTLLAENQCRDLSSKLVKTSTRIQELVIQFESNHRDDLFHSALEDFCIILEKAALPVKECSAADWCRASVFQSQNEEVFREILLEVGLCYNAIYEQAKWGQRANLVKKVCEVEDLRQTDTFLPASDSDVLEDQQTLRTRLEDWLAKNSGSPDDQILTRYLLGRLQGTSKDERWIEDQRMSDAILLQVTETEAQKMWDVADMFAIASGSGGMCVLGTKWLGIPCAKKIFPDLDAGNVDFRNEALVLASLNHPNIVKFFCCGNETHKRQSGGGYDLHKGQTCFIGMELIAKLFCRGNGIQRRQSFRSNDLQKWQSFSGNDLQMRQCFIGMELMEMSLQGLIQARQNMGGYFSRWESLDIILQIARGMSYLHDLGIAHRDLKPGNVVVGGLQGAYWCVKLVDFGLSKTKVQVAKSNTISIRGCGTTIFRAPEVDPNSPQGGYQKVNWMTADVFSFALTCSAILSLKEPFAGVGDRKKLPEEMVVNNLRPELPKGCPNYELSALLEECWATAPNQRPNFTYICAQLEKYKHDLMTIDSRVRLSRSVQDIAKKGVQSEYIEAMLKKRSQERNAQRITTIDEDEPVEASSSNSKHLDLEQGPATSQRKTFMVTGVSDENAALNLILKKACEELNLSVISSTSEWGQAAAYYTLATLGARFPKYNVMVVYANSMKYDFEDCAHCRIEGKSSGGGTVEVCVFKRGTVTLLGDSSAGGWCSNGKWTIANDKVTFSEP